MIHPPQIILHLTHCPFSPLLTASLQGAGCNISAASWWVIVWTASAHSHRHDKTITRPPSPQPLLSIALPGDGTMMTTLLPVNGYGTSTDREGRAVSYFWFDIILLLSRDLFDLTLFYLFGVFCHRAYAYQCRGRLRKPQRSTKSQRIRRGGINWC